MNEKEAAEILQDLKNAWKVNFTECEEVIVALDMGIKALQDKQESEGE